MNNGFNKMYDMIVENSRKYSDLSSSADAKALQTKGKDRKNRRIKVLVRVRRIIRVMGVDQVNIGLRIAHGDKHKLHRNKELSITRF